MVKWHNDITKDRLFPFFFSLSLSSVVLFQFKPGSSFNLHVSFWSKDGEQLLRGETYSLTYTQEEERLFLPVYFLEKQCNFFPRNLQKMSQFAFAQIVFWFQWREARQFSQSTRASWTQGCKQLAYSEQDGKWKDLEQSNVANTCLWEVIRFCNRWCDSSQFLPLSWELI